MKDSSSLIRCKDRLLAHELSHIIQQSETNTIEIRRSPVGKAVGKAIEVLGVVSDALQVNSAFVGGIEQQSLYITGWMKGENGSKVVPGPDISGWKLLKIFDRKQATLSPSFSETSIYYEIDWSYADGIFNFNFYPWRNNKASTYDSGKIVIAKRE